MMRASLVLVLLQWQHHAQAWQSAHPWQSRQRKVTTSSRTENDANRIDLNLCTSSVHANLGGLGGANVGDTGPEDKTADGKWKKELRYKRVATLPNGGKLDLVITNMTLYEANPSHAKQAVLVGNKAGGAGKNGRKGCLGSINIKAPGKVTLKFALVMQGTDNPAPKNYTYDFTVLDVDRSGHGMYEEVTAHGFASYVAPNIEPKEAGEFFTFASPVGGVEVPNPREAFRLTGAQLNASVGFVFANVNHWQITAGAIDAPKGGIGKLEVGRNLFFTGRSSLQSKMENSSPSDDAEPDDAAATKDEKMDEQKLDDDYKEADDAATKHEKLGVQKHDDGKKSPSGNSNKSDHKEPDKAATKDEKMDEQTLDDDYKEADDAATKHEKHEKLDGQKHDDGKKLPPSGKKTDDKVTDEAATTDEQKNPQSGHSKKLDGKKSPSGSSDKPDTKEPDDAATKDEKTDEKQKLWAVKSSTLGEKLTDEAATKDEGTDDAEEDIGEETRWRTADEKELDEAATEGVTS